MNKPPLLNTYKAGYVSVGLGSTGGHGQSYRNDMTGSRSVNALKFPATRAILWDHRHTGPASTIHITHYRNPVIVVEEKILRLLHRFAQDCSSDTYRCMLIGSLTTDPDGCGVVVSIDRLETGRGSTDDVVHLSQLIPGDIVIPCLVNKNAAKPSNSAEQYENAMSILCERFTAKSRIDVGHFLGIQANCSYHCNKQTFIFHIDFDMVTALPSFKASPVNSVPLVPTALSKNLSGPMNMSDVQGEPKSGYLTMDHTRKLLLVLESDPKINSLPLVGIWISGVANIHDPFVWASCLRYQFNKALQERICLAPEPFLITLYSPLRSKPEFYECVPFGGKANLDFVLSTCHEVVQLPKDIQSRSSSPMEIELVAVEHGAKKDVFDIALLNSKQKRLSVGQDKRQSLESCLSGSLEDITPRCKPAPHQTRAPVVKPSVPEVSLLFDDSAMSRSDEGHCRSRNSLEETSPHHSSHNNSGAFSQRHTSNMTNSSGSQQEVISAHNRTISAPNDQYMNYQQYDGSSYVQPHIYEHGPRGYLPRGVSGPQSPEPGTQNSAFTQQQYQTYAQRQFPMAPGSTQPGADSMANVGAYPGPPHPGIYPGYNGNLAHEASQPRPVAHQGRPGPPPGCRPGMRPPGNVGYRPAAPHHTYPGPAVPGPGYPGMPLNQTIQQQPVNPAQAYTNPAYRTGDPVHHQLHQQGLVTQYKPGSQVSNFTGDPRSSVQIQPQPQLSQVVTKMPSPRHQVQAPHSSDGLPQAHTAGADSSESSPVRNSGSTDSGLHSNDSADSGGHLIDQSASSSYGHVPPELYERLKDQDEQLKTLREQLATLLQKQNDSGNETTEDTQAKTAELYLQTHPKLPVATTQHSPVTLNTSTMLSNACTGSESHLNSQILDASHLESSFILQQNPQNNAMFNNRRDVTKQAKSAPNRPQPNLASSQPSSVDNSPQRGLGHGSQFPSPIQQQSSIEMGRGTLSNDTLSLGEFQLTQIQDGTQESIMSDMIVDLPDYTSMSPEKLGGSSSGYADTDSNRSPILGESVSMYEQQGMNGYMGRERTADQEQVEMSEQDQKQFFKNLIGNVQKLLAKHSTGDEGASSNPVCRDDPISTPNGTGGQGTPQFINKQQQHFLEESVELEESISVEEMTRKALEGMGINLDQCHSNDTTKTFKSDPSFFFNSILLPKVNYTSMMLESGESDLSHEADALSMKYLSDEQLSALAQQRVARPHHNRRDPGLERVVNNTLNASGKSDASMYGLSPNHMSFASRKYLERYGLADSRAEQTKAPKRQEADPILRDHPALANVQQYLRKLNDCSLNQSGPSDDGEAAQATGDVQEVLHHRGTSSYENSQPRCHSAGESFMSDRHSSTYSYPSASSDITSNRPADQSKHRNGTPTGTPVRNHRHLQQNPAPVSNTRYTGGGDCSTPTHAQKPHVHEANPPAADRILDIERLKKLPKLL